MFEQGLIPNLIFWSALSIALGWLAPKRWQTTGFFICGAGLLGAVAPISLLTLGTASLLTYGIKRRAQVSKLMLAFGILMVGAAYVLFMLLADHDGDGMMTKLVLPLGMAYYTLRLIHYLLDAYKGNLRSHSLMDYLCYQFFPATLPIGPIHRFDEFMRDLRRRRWDSAHFAYGLHRVLYGSAKLVLLGNYLLNAKLAGDLALASSAPGLAGVYITALVFWLRLYIMFSGFSDLAIGLSAMAGFRIRENFNWPFIARNISDFWQRWHMSLSSWCRDYVYTPVLAWRRNHVIAVLASMVVLGLWHEISLHYLLWGAYHGAGIAAYRKFAEKFGDRMTGLGRPSQWLWRVTATLLTVHFVIFSFPITTFIERLISGV